MEIALESGDRELAESLALLEDDVTREQHICTGKLMPRRHPCLRNFARCRAMASCDAVCFKVLAELRLMSSEHALFDHYSQGSTQIEAFEVLDLLEDSRSL